ncbi:hypothetical protein EOL96_03235 [Candidatus Saccharibacteria bacterium]|nr:hypothetical protein [Candidatus Saccharibacteria bacterium]
MATRTAQRWGILAILIVTVIGTLGSFAVMVLSTQNQANDDARLQQIQAEYQAKYEDYQAELDKQSSELSAKYYTTFKNYESFAEPYALESVTDLVMNDIVVGSGEEITGTTKFAAYYIGWNPKGKIFDQSIEGDKLKAPLYDAVGLSSGLDGAGLIQGWIEGMKGMRIGGVREIAIPSDKAYGEAGQGDDIPANTPIKFIVMAIEPPDLIEQPEVPLELYQGIY